MAEGVQLVRQQLAGAARAPRPGRDRGGARRPCSTRTCTRRFAPALRPSRGRHRRGLAARLPAGRPRRPAGPRGRLERPAGRGETERWLTTTRRWACRKGASRRRDQEGVPQARPPVPPRPQRRGRGGGGAVQAGAARRTTCSPTRRSESSTTPSARRSGRARARRRAASRASTWATAQGFDLGDLFGGLFNRGGRRGAGARAAPASAARDIEVAVRVSVRGRAARRHAEGAGGQGRRLHRVPRHRRGARHVTHDLPGLQGPRRDVREPGLLLDLSHTCRRCGGAGTIIETPCGVCGGSGRVRSTKTYRVRIPAGVRNGTRIKVKGKGEAAPRGGEPGDLYVVTPGRPRARSSNGAATTWSSRCP